MECSAGLAGLRAGRDSMVACAADCAAGLSRGLGASAGVPMLSARAWRRVARARTLPCLIPQRVDGRIDRMDTGQPLTALFGPAAQKIRIDAIGQCYRGDRHTGPRAGVD